MATFSEKATRIYDANPKPRDNAELARRLRIQINNTDSIQTVHQRLTAIISYPLSRIVQHFADISHLEFKKDRQKKKSRKKSTDGPPKYDLHLTTDAQAVFGVSILTFVIISDQADLARAILKNEVGGVICPEWSTELVQTSIIIQFLIHAGIWDNYVDICPEDDETKPLTKFLTTFPELDHLIDKNWDFIEQYFSPVIREIQIRRTNLMKRN
ncbi:MAG: hypothetical protein O2840_01220 [bacterium]|nr:hypothetical protein [bacterium]